jgi:hypothetical protein
MKLEKAKKHAIHNSMYVYYFLTFIKKVGCKKDSQLPINKINI